MTQGTPTKKARCSLPAVLMRAGTSKGLFIHRQHLPPLEAAWSGPLLAVMGSQHSDARQIDGVGGATSTTSKVAVVSRSSRPGVDVDYTFAQVAVGQEMVDFSGNCGNICSGVGPFALQEGLIQAKPGEEIVEVRIFNTNTSRTIVETVEVDENGTFIEDGSYVIPGVKGTGSEIKVAFVNPGGSVTGKLFPTGRRSDVIFITERNGAQFSVSATLIDAANPFIVVDETSLPDYLRSCATESPSYLESIESIRRAGAVMMGLAPDVNAAAKVRGTPKIAIVSPYRTGHFLKSEDGQQAASIYALAFSMGKVHPSIQLTGAACLASATCIEGTVAHKVACMQHQGDDLLPTPERTPSPLSDNDNSERKPISASDLLPDRKSVRISHSSGSMDVEVLATCSDTLANVDRCIVSRTARRLFEGTVYYYQ